ncbi:MAG TPA: hypothetical protein DIW30_05690 [Bacteroidales bacterium]|nr:hypothetical protein [Bacteroidales bacterium]
MRAKSHIIALVGTLVFMLLLFLLLWVVYIDRPESREEEGIMVSFGDSDMGEGSMQESVVNAVQEVVTPPAPPQQPSSNDLLTQQTDESLVLAEQRRKEERKQQEEQERIRRQKEADEKARIEAERIAKEKAAAEERAKQQAAVEKAQKLMGGAFSSNVSSSSGSGNSQGNTMQGNPVGQGSSAGHSWSLRGRSLQGRLSTPKASGVQEGRVVVAIRVNAAGKVVSATQGVGTTISEKTTIQACIDASYKAVFSAGDNDVIGTITYKFMNK